MDRRWLPARSSEQCCAKTVAWPMVDGRAGEECRNAASSSFRKRGPRGGRDQIVTVERTSFAHAPQTHICSTGRRQALVGAIDAVAHLARRNFGAHRSPCSRWSDRKCSAPRVRSGRARGRHWWAEVSQADAAMSPQWSVSRASAEARSLMKIRSRRNSQEPRLRLTRLVVLVRSAETRRLRSGFSITGADYFLSTKPWSRRRGGGGELAARLS